VALFRKQGYEVIIVDTSGRHRQEAELFREMQDVQEAVSPDTTMFVMDATQGQALYDQAQAFQEAVDVGGVIVTKLDSDAKGGGALSAVAATGSPIMFFGTGEHFDDLQAFDPRGFVGRLLGMGDLKGLLTTMKDRGLDNPEIAEKLIKGQFTMRDMYDQFENIMKLGPISNVMNMLPGGIGDMMKRMGGSDSDASNRFKKFMCIMDSMTDAELDGLAVLTDSRMERVALGSGARVEEVHMLVQMHKQFEKMVGRMGKSGLMKGGEANFAKQAARNPKAVMQQLQKAMDPRMMAQLGGAGNMMNMMKQMAGMDMSQMASMLGGGGGRGGGGLPPGFKLPGM
jgi:signal recognition particle subunit SRP54